MLSVAYNTQALTSMEKEVKY